MRMPLTVWGIFAAAVMALLAFPGLFVACVMLLLDSTLGTSFFMPAMVEGGELQKYGGGSPILFQHLFWFFGHPEVYIVALPAFGIVSDLLSVHARKNIFGYKMMVWAIVAIGVLSMIVWGHHMYISGMDPLFGFFFAITTLAIAVPTALKVYNWVLTLWHGDIHFTTPMLFALGFLVTFVNGGLTGLLSRQCHRRRAAVGDAVRRRPFPHGDGHRAGSGDLWRHLSLVPEDHRPHDGRAARQDPLLDHLPGSYAIFFPMHYLGLLGVPRRFHEMGEMAFVPHSAAALNHLHHRGGFGRRLRPGRSSSSICSGACSRASSPTAIPGAPTTLEWQTPETPPGHGNWGEETPVVYRWAYAYNVPGAARDFLPQNEPPAEGRTLAMMAMEPFCPWSAPSSPSVARPSGGDAVALAGRGRHHRFSRRGPGAERGQNRPGRVSRRRLLPVRAARQRLLHAHGDAPDWQAPPAPGILWFNTGVLVASSLALHLAQSAAKRGEMERVRAGVIAGGVCALVFLAGQILGLAGVERPRVFPRQQSRQRLLLPAHRTARGASPRRLGGARLDRRQGRGADLDRSCARRTRRVMRHLLALSPVRMVRAVRHADGLDK